MLHRLPETSLELYKFEQDMILSSSIVLYSSSLWIYIKKRFYVHLKLNISQIINAFVPFKLDYMVEQLQTNNL
jgi:hypothetical protein